MKIKRILVPVDFSEQTEGVIHQAATLARQFDATMTFLHVHVIETIAFMDMTYVEPGPQISDVCEAAQRKLQELAKQVVAPKPEIEIRVETGRPAEEVIRASSDHDLIVMPTHGRSGLSHFLLGSVAERVVRGSKCSVLILKDNIAGAPRVEGTPSAVPMPL